MKNVTVYTKYRCPKCEMTKNVLNGEDIPFQSINVEDDEKAMAYIKDELGFSEMPVVIVEGEKPFTGFQPDKLVAIKG